MFRWFPAVITETQEWLEESESEDDGEEEEGKAGEEEEEESEEEEEDSDDEGGKSWKNREKWFVLNCFLICAKQNKRG